MKLQNTLTLDCIKCAVPISSKKRILEEISTLAADQITDLSQHQLLNCLMKREKMGSTGIGNGIAIPHGRLPQTDRAIAIVITTQQPIPFDAIDNKPVDIFIALFAPENACDEHLSTLQNIVQIFGNSNTAKQVRKCQTAEQLFAIITQSN